MGLSVSDRTPWIPGVKSCMKTGDNRLALLCAALLALSYNAGECGAREFVNRWNAHGPAHHCAVGVGHLAHKTQKLGALLGLEVHAVY